MLFHGPAFLPAHSHKVLLLNSCMPICSSSCSNGSSIDSRSSSSSCSNFNSNKSSSSWFWAFLAGFYAPTLFRCRNKNVLLECPALCQQLQQPRAPLDLPDDLLVHSQTANVSNSVSWMSPGNNFLVFCSLA